MTCDTCGPQRAQDCRLSQAIRTKLCRTYRGLPPRSIRLVLNPGLQTVQEDLTFEVVNNQHVVGFGISAHALKSLEAV